MCRISTTRSAWRGLIRSLNLVTQAILRLPNFRLALLSRLNTKLNTASHFSTAIVHSNFSYPNDSFGIDGNLRTTIIFDEVQSWIAFDLPGLAQIELYSDDQLFHSWTFGGGGPGHFAGIISDTTFDKVVIFDPSDNNVA